MKVRYENQYYIHFCLGCNEEHLIPHFDGRPHWDFNGNFDLPTFSPSIKHSFHDKGCCHYFIRNGQIEYCGDCDHNLAGKTVLLPELKVETA